LETQVVERIFFPGTYSKLGMVASCSFNDARTNSDITYTCLN